ncbi:NUDIX hydrolase [Chromobacterium vaccinii]|nr:hypothetical protein [Chromobacterium vaccinii]SUX29680.1 Uncharacterised protein [Chromobacterium vaccinii]
MKHRIAAGVIVEHEDRILMVRHCKPGAYDFWVAPRYVGLRRMAFY